MIATQSVGVALSLGLPLALATALLVAPLRGVVVSLASWVAAVPALVIALAPGAGTVEESALLLGARLSGPDALARALLLGASLLWVTAGRFAHTYVAESKRRDSFWLFFLVTMAGNFGVILAHDVVSFYLFYAVMTFSAYGLVLHDRTDDARRAGRVYLVLALTGEVMLLAAFWLIVGTRVDLTLNEVPRAIASDPQRGWMMGLLLAGFGVKAGAVPLHVWLPLAHPVAPTPASAILSGALVKAGLLGWLRFLPLGDASEPDLGTAVSLVGLLTVFYGAAIGVTQRDPKTVLAYSSVSQMGFTITALGVVLVAPSCADAGKAALVVFALHHSIAKGALFLATAVVPKAGSGWPRRLARAGVVVPALAIAGAPLTSGAVAKASLKSGLEGAPAASHAVLVLLSIGAVGSTLLMARFLGIVLQAPRAEDEKAPPRGLWVPWALLLVVGNVLFFVRVPGTASMFAIDALWSASWPILVGAAMVLLARRVWPAEVAKLAVPPGDVVVVLERELRRARVRIADTLELAHARRWVSTVYSSVLEATRARSAFMRIEGAEHRLADLDVIGTVVLLMLTALAALVLR